MRNEKAGGVCWLSSGTANKALPRSPGLLQHALPAILHSQHTRVCAYPQLGLLAPTPARCQSQLHTILFLGVITFKCVYSSHAQRPYTEPGANHAGHDGNATHSVPRLPGRARDWELLVCRPTSMQTSRAPPQTHAFGRGGSSKLGCASASPASCLPHQHCHGKAPSSQHADAFCSPIPKQGTHLAPHHPLHRSPSVTLWGCF